MAKKAYRNSDRFGELTQEESPLLSVVDKSDADIETKEAVKNFSSSPSQHTWLELSSALNKDSKLSSEQKAEVTKQASAIIFSQVYTFENCPSKIDDLVLEIRALSQMAHYNIVILAQRLDRLKAQEPWKKLVNNDGERLYSGWGEFLAKEVFITRETANVYRSIYHFFKDELHKNQELSVTKLKYFLPLLKAKEEKIPSKEKKKIKQKAMELVRDKDKSVKEIKEKTDELKEEYGLTEPKKLIELSYYQKGDKLLIDLDGSPGEIVIDVLAKKFNMKEKVNDIQ
jgi:hypothetical protein